MLLLSIPEPLNCWLTSESTFHHGTIAPTGPMRVAHVGSLSLGFFTKRLYFIPSTGNVR